MNKFAVYTVGEATLGPCASKRMINYIVNKSPELIGDLVVFEGFKIINNVIP
jgi:hypothetical protein